VLVPKAWARLSPFNAELAQIMKLPDVREKYTGLGVWAHTAPERLELIRLESPQMGRVLKAAGVELTMVVARTKMKLRENRCRIG
jgi:hypothetical protein